MDIIPDITTTEYLKKYKQSLAHSENQWHLWRHLVVNTTLMIAFCKKIALKQIVGAQIQTKPIKATSKKNYNLLHSSITLQIIPRKFFKKSQMKKEFLIYQKVNCKVTL